MPDAPHTPSMAIVSHLYPQRSRPHLGVFVHEQVRALAELGAPVSAVAVPVPWAPLPLPWLSAKWRGYAQTERERTDFGVVRVHFPRTIALPRKALPMSSAASACRAILRDPGLRAAFESAEVLIAHTALLDGAVARLLARRSGAPYIVFVHGEDLYEHLGPHASRDARSTVVDALSDAAMVVAVSDAVLRGLEEAVPGLDRISVLHNGVDVVEFVPAAATPHNGALRTLSAGHLVPRKGNDVVLRAIAHLVASGIEVEHTIAGDGPERAALHGLADRLGIADRVRFTGAYHHVDLPALLHAADLFLLPSWNEAFGVVYLEAMACGVPVVAATDGGATDFVEHGTDGYLVPPHDAAAVKSAVARFAALSPDARSRMRASARAKAETFTWERNARGLIDIVSAVAARA